MIRPIFIASILKISMVNITFYSSAIYDIPWQNEAKQQMDEQYNLQLIQSIHLMVSKTHHSTEQFRKKIGPIF